MDLKTPPRNRYNEKLKDAVLGFAKSPQLNKDNQDTYVDCGQSEKCRASQRVPNFPTAQDGNRSVLVQSEKGSLLSKEPCVHANTACPLYVQIWGGVSPITHSRRLTTKQDLWV